MTDIIIVYREESGEGRSPFNHIIGDEPGTTLCGKSTVGLEEREHPVSWAANWCRDCMRVRWNIADKTLL